MPPDPRPDPHQFLGKRVRVTRGPHQVQEGILLGFGDGGDYELEDSGGFVWHGWPMLAIEDAGAPCSSLAEAIGYLAEGADFAGNLTHVLRAAQNATGGLYVKGDTDA